MIQLARFTGLVGEEDCWWTRKINTEVSFPTQGFQVCRNSSQLGSGYALFAVIVVSTRLLLLIFSRTTKVAQVEDTTGL